MRTYLAGCVGVALLLGISACTTEHDDLIGATVGLFERLNATLEGVTDEASARAAEPELTTIAEEMAVIQKEVEKRGEPSAEVEAEAMKRLQPEHQKLQAHMMRLATKPGVLQVLQGVFEKMGGPMAAK